MTERAPAIFAAALACLAAAGARGQDFDTSQQIGPNPVLPEPTHALVTAIKVAKVVGWSAGQTPAVAEGLKITPYATDLGNPRNVHTLPNGDVLVVQSQGPDAPAPSRPKDLIQGWIMSYAHGFSAGDAKPSNMVTLLRDTDRDGTVDERHDLVTGLKSPFGIAWADGTLYVGATDAVLAYPYELGQTEITAAPRVLTPLPGGPIDHHWTKDLVLSPDGRFLYAGVGSNSNITENGLEAEHGRAAIWQIDRATGAARVFASGLRNPNGLRFEPGTGTLFAVVNERDELGPNLVPDYLTSVKDGAFYGWPWSYYGNHVDVRVQPPRPDMVAKAIPPDYALSSHVAPLGMTFSEGSALPAAFAHGAFVGEHGSWNRDHYNGYKVVYVPFQDGKPSGQVQDVVTDFIDAEHDQVHGRPVGVAIDGTGALIIADDAGNTVWRVAAANGSISPAPVGTDAASAEAAAPASPAAPAPAGATAEGQTPSPLQVAPSELPGQGTQTN